MSNALQPSLLDLIEEVRELPLTRGYVSLVSACDYEWLNQWKWVVIGPRGGKFYAARWIPKAEEDRKLVWLHRVITDAPFGFEVDHINSDSLDNRRPNLRICTHLENRQNSAKRKSRSSIFKGVSWDKSKGKWLVGLTVNYKPIRIGLFTNEADAARAYDAAALKYYGEFARLNFPTGEQS